jgi:NADH-quinone oxidoreductase subunit E
MGEETGTEALGSILMFYEAKRSELIPILQETQGIFGYLPEEPIAKIADFLKITTGEVYSVASFYNQFRLMPLGRNIVTLCRGTACHIKGAPQILEEISKAINLQEGETSEDMEYTLETVACIGCCALAPCLKINHKIYGDLDPAKTRDLFPA